MINFNKYDGDPYTLFENALIRMHSSNAKKAIIANNKQNVKDRYEHFNNELNRNHIEHIAVNESISMEAADALRDMYKHKCKLVNDFSQWFDDNNPRTYYRMCPYCTINQAKTIEHILPKELYPEFAINVHNLIPACSDCNSLKGESVLDCNNEKIIINFYTDILPNEQFLFAEISYDKKGNLECKYRLENPNNTIDEKIYRLLQRHYDKLDLLNRLKDKAITEIPSLICEFEGYDYEESVEYIKSKYTREKRLYGINYWKIVLYLAAIDSSIFKDYIINKKASSWI